MFMRWSLIVLLLAAAGCSRERTSVAVDAALLTQVPGDTIALGAMRVKALRQTAAWKKLLEQPGVNEQLNKLAAETSFDARKDLWEILWSTDGKEGLVYARGEFAPMGLEPKIEREGVQRMNYKGSMLLGNEASAVWFVNSSTGIFGHTAKIRQLIDARDSEKPGPAAALRERIDAFPPNSHFWAVADAAALPNLELDEDPIKGGMSMNFLQNLPKLMQSVKLVTMQANLMDGIAMETTVFCDSERGAQQVQASLRGIVGLARLALPVKERTILLPLLDAMEVTQKQAEATLRVRATVQQIENMQPLLTPSPERRKSAD